MTLAALNLSPQRGTDAALDLHRDIARRYESAWNAHSFDFESDVGRFFADDVTIVSGGVLGGRSVLRELSDARAEYVRNSSAVAHISVEVTCVADLESAATVVAEVELGFAYPDRAEYVQRTLVSCTLRRLGDRWVIQHVHCGLGHF